jgi:tetratricopeptide (TPR) repeat protein
MIRAVASAAVLVALMSGGAVVATRTAIVQQNSITGWGKAPIETRLAVEDWPICTTMPILGTESDWAQLDPDFAAGKKALAAEDWSGAIVALKLAVLRDPRNADIQNYIGYAYRQLRRMGPAMGHFQQALMFNPRHRSAHEHLGELYLTLGEPKKAEEQLAALKEICLIPCRELADLERAVAAFAVGSQRLRL